MLKPGEYAEVLRVIGWRLDDRLAGQETRRVEVAVKGSGLLVSWQLGQGEREHERHGPAEIDQLREQARALREGRAERPAGTQAEHLRTIGQHLDENRIILERLVTLPHGHHIVGTLNSRTLSSWYDPDLVEEMSAERRKRRGRSPAGPISVATSSPPVRMPVEDLQWHMRALSESGKHVSVVWQEPNSLAFVARGREHRSEFHIDPTDELMYMIKGDMRLHYRTPEGGEEVTVLPEGSVIYTPAGTPHSPRFGPDAFVFVIERPRAPGEIDRFLWFCPNCGAFLHEEQCVVDDYRADPVSAAYQRFYNSEVFRTCRSCGAVMPAPKDAR